MDTWNEWHVVLLAPWGWPGRVFALCAVALVLVLAWRALRRDTRRRRYVLLSLRGLGLVSALVLFFQPAIQLRQVTRVPNHVAVLFDVSESMNLAERSEDGTRAQRAAQLLRRESAVLSDWRKEHKLDFFTFGDRLLPSSEESLTGKAGPPAHADATRIREALSALRQRYERRDLAGVVVLSDGLDNGRMQEGGPALDADTRDFLRALDAPVHTVAIGRPGLRDVAVARVLADEFAFARTPVQVEARLLVHGAELSGSGTAATPGAARLRSKGATGEEATGKGDDDASAPWTGRRLPVTLRRDGTPIMTVDVDLLPGQREYRVVFPFTPERVGKYLYEIATPVLPGEAISENNRRAFVLRVIRDKIRVVHVAGRPTWDVRFLRELLKHDPNVDLVSFFILRSPSDIDLGPSSETSLIPFPCEELFQQQLRSFDLIILHNFNYNAYCAQYLQPAIVPFVEDGGALMMIGGDLSFSSGGYYGSEVAQVLPVELSPDPAPSYFVGPREHDRLINPTTFQPRLSPEGRSHVVTALRLDVRENEARWAALPPLLGVNLVARARPSASVLLTHPSLRDADGRPMPVLAVSEHGKGRSLALLADSTWRWGFSAGAEGTGREARTGRGASYQHFFEQSIRWLIRDPSLRLLRVETTESEYGREQPVRIEVKAMGPDYKAAARAEVQLVLSRVNLGDPVKDGEVTTVLSRTVRTNEDGEAHLELESLRPGGYRVTARATLSGRPAEEIEVFLVRGASRELEAPEADDGLLRALSEATGGLARRADDGLGGLRFHEPHVVRVNKHRDVMVWDRLFVLIVAALCFGLNWTLRRRWGYA